MTPFPLLLVPLFPLLIAILAVVRTARAVLPWTMILAPLPALILAFSSTVDMSKDIPSLLMGVRLELDATRKAFLLFTALLWIFAAWSTAIYLIRDPQRTRFCVFFLISMAGNFGLILAGDVASFYTFFSMMSLSAWGLVAHERSDFASFAGRSYIAFAIAGELALFSGLTIAAYGANSLLLADIQQAEIGGIAFLLLGLGFGIKLGVAPLHLWLPLAHAAAPAPASAVLSGAMIKAGLFSAITVLPIGLVSMGSAGLVVIAMGGASVALATLIGVTQNNPKAVLAYSSVAQMGLVAMALGTGLAAPEAWVFILPALVVFAAHHAFAKAALFLGVPAVWSINHSAARVMVLALLAIPAFVLAAAPWTSGALAKAGLKDALLIPVGVWGPALDPILLLSSLGTALLMMRFFWLMARAEAKPQLSRWLAGPWSVMVMLAIGGIWLAPFEAPGLSPDQLSNALPIMLATGLAGVVYLLMQRSGLVAREVPPGEILALFRFAEPGATPIKARLPAAPNVHWPRALFYQRLQSSVQQSNGGIALLIILVAIIVAGLATHPELQLLR